MITINDRDLSHELYQEIQALRPDLFKSQSNINYILDPTAIERYEQETGETIGVLYKMNDYELFVVDLIDKKGKLTLHGRIILPYNGVVIIPKIGDKFILENQYRYPVCLQHLVFPSGHCEPNATPEEDAIREIKEELRGDLKNPIYLGKTYPETHSDAWFCSVFSGDVQGLVISPEGTIERNGYEGIQNLIAYTAEEIDQLIKDGKIDCGYTLAAWALYKSSLNQ